MKTTQVNDLNWDEEVTKSELPVLVDFTATWCGPCRVMSPIIDRLAIELESKIKVCKLDIDDAPVISTKQGIRAVPTVMVFVAGERKACHVGLTTRAKLLEMLPK